MGSSTHCTEVFQNKVLPHIFTEHSELWYFCNHSHIHINMERKLYFDKQLLQQYKGLKNNAFEC